MTKIRKNKLFIRLKTGLEEAIAHQQGKRDLRSETIETSQTLKLGKFQDLLEAKFTKDELAEIDREVALEAAALRALQHNIHDLFENYMNLNNLKLDELAKKLDVTPKRLLKIQTGQSNLLLGTLAILAARLGKELVVSFREK